MTIKKEFDIILGGLNIIPFKYNLLYKLKWVWYALELLKIFVLYMYVYGNGYIEEVKLFFKRMG